MNPPLINYYETSSAEKAAALAGALRARGIGVFVAEGAHTGDHRYTVVYNGNQSILREARTDIEELFPSTARRAESRDLVEYSQDHAYLTKLEKVMGKAGFRVKPDFTNNGKVGSLTVYGIDLHRFRAIRDTVRSEHIEASH